MMVGNKADLAKSREVSYEEASRFAQENGAHNSTHNRHCSPRPAYMHACIVGLIYIEASAKSGEKVEDAFLQTANAIYNAIQNGRCRHCSTASQQLAIPHRLLTFLFGMPSGI